jgi:hypothetical protein
MVLDVTLVLREKAIDKCKNTIHFGKIDILRVERLKPILQGLHERVEDIYQESSPLFECLKGFPSWGEVRGEVVTGL